MNSSTKIRWYWHRLWAMSPREVVLRLQKKLHQAADREYRPRETLSLHAHQPFPKLPSKADAPAELRDALALDVEKILSGDWLAFGHLPMRLTDPPLWQADNLVARDLHSAKVAFKLDHRAQPGGADIKVIWEPNRWYQLVRLAMAAWLLDHSRAQEKCIEWLHDWASRNPPFTGLNWTSGLETGLRLISYTWIDAFLVEAGVPHKTLEELRRRLLPPHTWYTWRYKSFGSSANNHLIGELAGLIVAQARWPELAQISAPISAIGALMDREIIAQFAEDGGNNEQALGYHLFSWEFCFQSQYALQAAGHPLSPAAVQRLRQAGQFYAALKPVGDPWDFGDSDNAWVTPLFADETQAAREWWEWFRGERSALSYWWGAQDGSSPTSAEWRVFHHSGYAVWSSGDWFLRLDASPLGYLSMAPHGHLDALHLSIWFQGRPIIIDPGTGAYYADKKLRSYLADWGAHNGPRPINQPPEFPKRFGTFLWSEHHSIPSLRVDGPYSVTAQIDLPYGRATRTVTVSPEKSEIRVSDRFAVNGRVAPVRTKWKFAPKLHLSQTAPHEFTVDGVRLTTSDSWKMSKTFNPPPDVAGKVVPLSSALGNVPLDSFVSPAFRAVTTASYLVLESTDQGPFEIAFSPA